jgi:hypothetical protein
MMFKFRDTHHREVVQYIIFPNHELLVVTHSMGEEADRLEKDKCSASSGMDLIDRQEIHREPWVETTLILKRYLRFSARLSSHGCNYGTLFDHVVHLISHGDAAPIFEFLCTGTSSTIRALSFKSMSQYTSCVYSVIIRSFELCFALCVLRNP